MTKWEYAELEVSIGSTMSAVQPELYIFRTNGKHETRKNNSMGILFAELGEEGWELTTSNARVEPDKLSSKLRISYLFKRPKTE
jgi:hypothetical protein